jgi:hypothetical protein
MVAAVLALGILGSCAVSQETLLRPDGGAEAEVRVELSSVLVSYLEDLTLAFAPEAEFRVFDLRLLRANLEAEPGVSVVALVEQPIGTLHMTLDIASLETLGRDASPAIADLLSVEREASGSVLEMTLGPQEIARLLEFAGAADATALSVFLPPPATDAGGSGEPPATVTREGYIADAVWVLEEYASPEAVEEDIRSSGVEVAVTAPREIVAVEGGSREAQRALFAISLLDLVTLTEARRYRVHYR